MRRVWAVVAIKAAILFSVSFFIYIYLDIFVTSEVQDRRPSSTSPKLPGPVPLAAARAAATQNTGWARGPDIGGDIRSRGPQGVRGESRNINLNASLSYGKVAPHVKTDVGHRMLGKSNVLDLQIANDVRGPAGQFELQNEVKNKSFDSLEEGIIIEASGKTYFVPDSPGVPECPDGIVLNMDGILLSKLSLCAPPGSLVFEPELEIWRYNPNVQCSGRFVAYDKEAVLVRDAILDTRFAKGKVVNQTTSEEEFYKYEMGLFRLQCPHQPKQFFRGQSDNHVSRWLTSSVTYNGSVTVGSVIHEFTIAIVRYEYHNIYHSLTDVYNTFLAIKFFNVQPQNVRIILFDSHPKSPLDDLYINLFGEMSRLNDLKEITHFDQLFWNRLGYHSEFMAHSQPTLPYVEEFRTFFLDRFAIKDRHTLNCNSLNITLISRRDYVANRANPSGVLKRKIVNERELTDTIQNAYPSFSVRKLHLEEIRLRDQIEIMANTDILIGMHGAGLTHCLFLPKHAGVIEFIPKYWLLADRHFMGISRWRHLVYNRWRNPDPANEFSNYATRIPPQVMLDYINITLTSICPVKGA